MTISGRSTIQIQTCSLKLIALKKCQQGGPLTVEMTWRARFWSIFMGCSTLKPNGSQEKWIGSPKVFWESTLKQNSWATTASSRTASVITDSMSMDTFTILPPALMAPRNARSTFSCTVVAALLLVLLVKTSSDLLAFWNMLLQMTSSLFSHKPCTTISQTCSCASPSKKVCYQTQTITTLTASNPLL